MSIEELREELKKCAADKDSARGHGNADDLLIAFINDPEVTEIFENMTKWYE